jgi:hypothetical protein
MFLRHYTTDYLIKKSSCQGLGCEKYIKKTKLLIAEKGV